MNVLKNVLSVFIGFLNSFFGSGGGLVAVPLLKSKGLSDKEAHATSIAIILPVSVFSAILYYNSGNIDLYNAISFLPGGIAGAVTGALLLNKIPGRILKIIFTCFMIYSGVRMVFFN